MREKGKRLIAIILSCLLLLSNVTVYAATEAEEQSDTQNTVSVNASEEVVTLPEEPTNGSAGEEAVIQNEPNAEDTSDETEETETLAPINATDPLEILETPKNMVGIEISSFNFLPTTRSVGIPTVGSTATGTCYIGDTWNVNYPYQDYFYVNNFTGDLTGAVTVQDLSNINHCKSVVINEIVQTREMNLRINTIIRKDIVGKLKEEELTKDSEIKSKFLELCQNLPEIPKNRMNYGNKEMRQYRAVLDEISEKFLKVYSSEKYYELREILDRQSLLYTEAYGGDQGGNYKKNKLQELKEKMGNAVLKQAKDYIECMNNKVDVPNFGTKEKTNEERPIDLTQLEEIENVFIINEQEQLIEEIESVEQVDEAQEIEEKEYDLKLSVKPQINISETLQKELDSAKAYFGEESSENIMLKDKSEEFPEDLMKCYIDSKEIKYLLKQALGVKVDTEKQKEMTEIEEMAGMIKLAGGILQNLIVKPMDEEGYYVLTTGERRWRGARLLRDRNEYPAIFDNKVPCVIQDPVEIELPLNDEDKEDFAILVTNQYRVKTDAILYMEMLQWKRIISNLKKAGVEYLPKEFGSDQEIKLKGKRTRELVAEQMNLSTGQVARFEKIEKHGSEELISKLMRNELNLPEAEEFTKLDKEEQKEILQQSDPVSLKEEVQQKLKEKEKRVGIKPMEISKRIEGIMVNLEETVYIREKEYQKLERILIDLKKIMRNGEK